MDDIVMEMKALMKGMAQPGVIKWIGIRPEKRADLQVVKQVEVSEEEGLIGDHYQGKSHKRQVTLVQHEHLEAVASFLGKPDIAPELARRNLVVSGINLLSFKDHFFHIGEEVVLQMTGLCHPCSRMEENFGSGGYNAMRGHGGITARVVQGGVIRLGDAVRLGEKAMV